MKKRLIKMDYVLQIWFNSEKKLVRKDYKSAAGNDPDPTSEVFDFNLGRF